MASPSQLVCCIESTRLAGFTCRMGKMVEYRKSAHAVFDIKYHVVWIAKCRPVAERVSNRSRQICSEVVEA